MTSPPVGTDKVGASFEATLSVIFTVRTLEVVAIPSDAEIWTLKVWPSTATSFSLSTPLYASNENKLASYSGSKV